MCVGAGILSLIPRDVSAVLHSLYSFSCGANHLHFWGVHHKVNGWFHCGVFLCGKVSGFASLEPPSRQNAPSPPSLDTCLPDSRAWAGVSALQGIQSGSKCAAGRPGQWCSHHPWKCSKVSGCGTQQHGSVGMVVLGWKRPHDLGGNFQP